MTSHHGSSCVPHSQRIRPAWSKWSLAIVLLTIAGGVAFATAAHGASAPAGTHGRASSTNELTTGKAIFLGVVEGVTEFLPVSSTGHLTVAERLVDVGQSNATRDVTKSYTVMIQIGAIFAVLLLYWRRIIEIGRGLVGRSREGRSLLIALIVAFLPAALIGKLLEEPIESHLFGVGPVAAAWIVGGIVILIWSRRFRRPATEGISLEALSVKSALIIGVAQSLALWPGVSRSLVTILAALACGLTLSAAIEFSFLLGLAILSAATGYEMLRHGTEVTHAFGWSSPMIGIIAAAVSAAIAVKWMVAYLNRHSLDVFGYYRIAAGAAVIGLLVTKAI